MNPNGAPNFRPLLVPNVQKSIELVGAAPADIFVWTDAKCLALLLSYPDGNVCWSPFLV